MSRQLSHRLDEFLILSILLRNCPNHELAVLTARGDNIVVERIKVRVKYGGGVTAV